jgi:hypothetical protein
MRRALLLVAALQGCDSVPQTGTFSCDAVSRQPHTCQELSWTQAGWYDDTWSKSCTGLAGTGCPHAGAVAGCRDLSTAPYRTSVTWSYEGTVADVGATCLPPPTWSVVLP